MSKRRYRPPIKLGYRDGHLRDTLSERLQVMESRWLARTTKQPCQSRPIAHNSVYCYIYIKILRTHLRYHKPLERIGYVPEDRKIQGVFLATLYLIVSNTH